LIPHTIRIDEQIQPGHPAFLKNHSPTESANWDGSCFLLDLQDFGLAGEGVAMDDSISPAPLEGVIEVLQAAADEANHRFLTPSEAAEFLGGLHSRTVTRWAREGYLPSYPIGEGKRRLWRFLESDLERWMLSRRNRTGC